MEVVDADLLLLLATLRFRLSPRMESAGVQLRWDIQDIPRLEWLTPGTSLHILRILQEAFTNIIKHAHATEIRVATAVADGCIWVTVSNNGQGFDVERALHSGGKGMANQQRRAGFVGGRVQWHSSGAGSCPQTAPSGGLELVDIRIGVVHTAKEIDIEVAANRGSDKRCVGHGHATPTQSRRTLRHPPLGRPRTGFPPA